MGVEGLMGVSKLDDTLLHSKFVSSLLTLSNSSMQTTPPSASTMAPPSIMKLRDTGSLMTDAVNPAALLPLPDVYTPIGETFSTNFNS